MSNLKKKNDEVVQKIEVFMDTLKNSNAEEFTMSWLSPFLVLCEETSGQPIYFGSDFKVSFVVPLEDYDAEDWIDKNGITFSNRVAFSISKKHRKHTWRQLSVFQICQIIDEGIRVFHPSFDLNKLING